MTETKQIEEYEQVFTVEGLALFFSDFLLARSTYNQYNWLLVYKDGLWHALLSKKSLEKISEVGWNNINDDHWVRSYFHSLDEVTKKTLHAFKRIEKDGVSELSDEALREVLVELIGLAKSLWSVFFYSEFMFFIRAESELKKAILKEQRDVTEVAGILLTSEPEQNISLKADHHLTELALEILSEQKLVHALTAQVHEPALWHKVHAFIDLFDYVGFQSGGPAWTDQALLIMLKERVKLGKEELEKKVAEFHRKNLAVKRERRRVEILIKDKEILRLSNKLRLVQEEKWKLRVFINRTWMEQNIFRPFLEEAARRIGCFWKDFTWLEADELVASLLAKKLDKEKVAQRKISYVQLINNGNVKTIHGNLCVPYLEHTESGKELRSEVRGTTAYKGVYCGRAVVIPLTVSELLTKKMNSMQNGDILVAGSTGPEMMIACQKAGAIVTDEGGIMSHAAIVSRELRIPCVVGTKFATKVFKDGDILEVDAERGIVRKL